MVVKVSLVSPGDVSPSIFLGRPGTRKFQRAGFRLTRLTTLTPSSRDGLSFLAMTGFYRFRRR